MTDGYERFMKQYDARMAAKALKVDAGNPDETWSTLDYLLWALDKTCKRLGWIWKIERMNDETFCKATAHLLNKEDLAPLAILDVLIDAKDQKVEISRADEFIPQLESDSIRHEREIFESALEQEVNATLGRELPEIPSNRCKDRREKVRRMWIEHTEYKIIAKELKVSVEIVKKDIEWLKKRKLLPKR